MRPPSRSIFLFLLLAGPVPAVLGQAAPAPVTNRYVGKIEEENLYIDHFSLEEDGVPREPEGGRRAPRQLIRTSFSMKEGETIVVGTSKLDGGQEALVLLVTAVP